MVESGVGTTEGDVVLPTLHHRVINLLYLTLGAVNYPDVMLPSYIEQGSYYMIYFASFAVLYLFVFLSITFAVLYKFYTAAVDASREARQKALGDRLAIVYSIMDADESGATPRPQSPLPPPVFVAPLAP